MTTVTPDFLEALKWLITFGAMILFTIGAWWGKAMAKQITDLQTKQNATDVSLGKIEEAMRGRDQLQDERWSGLNSKLDTLQRNVETLIQVKLNDNQKQKSE